MEKSELAKSINRVAHLQGDFILRSGQHATDYFDKYRFESDPVLLKSIADHLAALLPENFNALSEALAGLEMGGIPIATTLALKVGCPVFFIRKVAKTYGTCQLAEGGDVAGRRLVIVEDVITTAGAVVNAVKALRELGASVDTAICVIDRESTGRKNLSDLSVELRALFIKSELDAFLD